MKNVKLKTRLRLALLAILHFAFCILHSSATSVYFPVAEMTGSTNDVTLNVRAVNNPMIYNGSFYYQPRGGTNLTTVGGYVTNSFVPGRYTVTVAGLQKAWNMYVTNSSATLSAVDLSSAITVYSGIQSISGRSIEVTNDGLGHLTITDTNSGSGSAALNLFQSTNLPYAGLSAAARTQIETNAAWQAYLATNGWVGGGGGATSNFLNGNNTTWSVSGGSNRVDVTGTLTNNTTGNATTATTATTALAANAASVASAGDSATSFFPAGTIEDARLPLNQSNKVIFTEGPFLHNAATATEIARYDGAAWQGTEEAVVFDIPLVAPDFAGLATGLTTGSPALATNNGTASDGMVLSKQGNRLSFISVAGGGDLIGANSLADIAGTGGSLALARTNLGANSAANLTAGIIPLARVPSIPLSLVTNASDLTNATGIRLITAQQTNAANIRAIAQTPWIGPIDANNEPLDGVSGISGTNNALVLQSQADIAEAVIYLYQALPSVFSSPNYGFQFTGPVSIPDLSGTIAGFTTNAAAAGSVSNAHHVAAASLSAPQASLGTVTVDMPPGTGSFLGVSNYLGTLYLVVTNPPAGGGLLAGDIDTSAELRAIVGDESGTGALLFAGGAIGAATATTPAENDNDTSVATTAYVQTEIAGLGTGTGSTNMADVGTNAVFKGNIVLTNAGQSQFVIGATNGSGGTDLIEAFYNSVKQFGLGTNGQITAGQAAVKAGTHTSIFGGLSNRITSGTYSQIIGGTSNTLADFFGSTILGGEYHDIRGLPINVTILGGAYNSMDGSDYSFIGNGWSNRMASAGYFMTILNGEANLVGLPTASPFVGHATILGGISNNLSAQSTWAIGNYLTNGVTNSVDVGFNNQTKTSFNSNNVVFRSPLIGDAGSLTNYNATNVIAPGSVLTTSGTVTNFMVQLLPGNPTGLQTIHTLNTNVFITFTGTNADWSRSILLRGWTNTVSTTVTFAGTSLVKTNLNFAGVVTNGMSKVINFYCTDGTNILATDGGFWR